MPSRTPSKWARIIIPLALVLTWFGLASVGGPYFGRIEEVSEVDLTAFLPESAEATRVSERLGEFQDDDAIPAVIVLKADDPLSDEQKDAIEPLREGIAELEYVFEASPAIYSDDDTAALLLANVNTDGEIKETTTQIRERLDEANVTGVESFITGPAGFASDLNTAFAGIDGLLLLTALSVVFVILIIVYRSVLLPIIVLLTSIFALSASILLVFSLAKAGVVELNGQVQGILFILVIGAATDYSLLYVARFREALFRHKRTWDATTEAFKGAFEPILASGGTVIVGLLCLLLSDLASNKALGPVGSIGIAFAVASALTFLPSVLLLIGRAAFWPSVPKASLKDRVQHAKAQKRNVWVKVGDLVAKHPRRVWASVLIVLVVMAAFAPQIRADGVAQSDLILGYSEAREGQEVLSEAFPAGSGSPAQILVDESDVEEVVRLAEDTDGVEGVSGSADGTEAESVPLGKDREELLGTIREAVEERYEALPPPARALAPPVEIAVESADPFKDAELKVRDGQVLLQATLSDDPNSDEAKATIERLRDRLHDFSESALVGGITASQLDTTTASIRDRAVIIPVVLIAITLILMILLRSIFAPILLLATTVLSFGSALGVSAVLFNNVLGFPGADPSVVLYGFVFLVALGIDYNIFLMTRVREESLKIGTAKGVIKGLVVTGGVITSAGIVLAATFAALSVIPILFLVQLAFVVAFGVLLDTFVVRSLLVPALIRDIGSVAWWPSRIKK